MVVDHKLLATMHYLCTHDLPCNGNQDKQDGCQEADQQRDDEDGNGNASQEGGVNPRLCRDDGGSGGSCAHWSSVCGLCWIAVKGLEYGCGLWRTSSTSFHTS